MADSTPPEPTEPPQVAPAAGITITVRPGLLVGQAPARQIAITGLDPVAAMGILIACSLDLYNAINEQAQRAAGAHGVPVAGSLLRVQ